MLCAAVRQCQGHGQLRRTVAADVLRDDMPVSDWPEGEDNFLFDVRQPMELGVENVSGTVTIPLAELRNRSGGMLSRFHLRVFS